MSEFIFANAQKLGNKEYMIFLDGATLIKYWEKYKISYIPEIQRGMKTVLTKEGIAIKTPVFSQSNVQKIKKTMLNHSFYVNQITLNLLEQGSKLKYNNETKELRLVRGELAILDGQHRLRALKELKDENDKFDPSSIIFPVKITNYNEEQAQEQFYQFTLGNKVSTSRGEYFNNKDFSNKIVKELAANSFLNKIETVKNIIGNLETSNVVSFATLKNAIDISFNTKKISDTKEIEKITQYLDEFFKELFIHIPEFNDYDQRMILKLTQSLKCDNFTFYGYIAIAKELYSNENWKELLPSIKNIDFYKSSPLWVSQVIKKNVLKRKSKNQNQEARYTIINNSQSRKEMGKIIVRAFNDIINKI